MNYLDLPVHLLRFWFEESFFIFLRSWRNTLAVFEEDLAVRLMLRLLFKPLFHDRTFVGLVMSFSFRMFRVIFGLLVMFAVSVIMLTLAVIWWLLPVAAVMVPEEAGIVAKVLVLLGLGLFFYHVVSAPHKKVKQIKNADEVFACSLVKKEEIDFARLLKNREVLEMLFYLELTPGGLATLVPLPSFDQMISLAWDLGKQTEAPYLSAGHFFLAYILGIPDLDSKLLKMGLTSQDFRDLAMFWQRKVNAHRLLAVWDDDFHTRHLRGVNRGWTAVPTPELNNYSEDITLKAAHGEASEFIGRQQYVKQVVDILSLEKGRNVVIVGEAGSGRTTLVDSLAQAIIAGDAPSALATKKLVRLNIAGLITGIRTQGELAERIKNIFEDVKFCGDIILCIDEIQNLGMGEAGTAFNTYSLLLPYIESSNFQFIATTDPASFARILEKNASFTRLFVKVDLPPASPEETLDVLENRALEKERHGNIHITLLAQKELVKLSAHYIHDRCLPDSALQLFAQLLPRAENGWIKKAAAESLVQEITHIPVGEAQSAQKLQLLDLENLIHQKLVDQEEAVSAVANTLRRSAAHLREETRPIGSFLFVGPTGVGKTELAKILSEIYFKGEGNFLRLDMSEFQTPDSVKRLIGEEGNEGVLTEEVRHKPYTLILLDEFEKADSKVLTVFLQVLDDGRLTDYSGHTVDFTSTIIIATSNAASLTIAEGISQGWSVDQLKKPVSEELLKIFKPELINRFDEVVLFKPLSPENLEKIVQIKLTQLQKQLKDQGFLIEFDKTLVSALTRRGFDPVLGARPMRRLIQDTLESKLSVLILAGKLPKGEKFIAGEQILA